MTNFEWLIKENTELVKGCLLGYSDGVAVNFNGRIDGCNRMACRDCIFNLSENCKMQRTKWLEAERNPYTIPLDTPIDAKVLVSSNGDTWRKRYFAGFDHSECNYERPYLTFDDGATSWSVLEDTQYVRHTSHWRYCKLAEENEE